MTLAADFWEIIKVIIIPLMAIIFTFIRSKLESLNKDMRALEEKIREQEKKLIFVESTYATKAELAQAMNQINSTLLANNSTLEQKIEKIMDLKNAPIKMMLDEIKSKINSKE